MLQSPGLSSSVDNNKKVVFFFMKKLRVRLLNHQSPVQISLPNRLFQKLSAPQLMLGLMNLTRNRQI